jgi:hypothetical protein
MGYGCMADPPVAKRLALRCMSLQPVPSAQSILWRIFAPYALTAMQYCTTGFRRTNSTKCETSSVGVLYGRSTRSLALRRTRPAATLCERKRHALRPP